MPQRLWRSLQAGYKLASIAATLLGLFGIWAFWPQVEIVKENVSSAPTRPFSEQLYLHNQNGYKIYDVVTNCGLTGSRAEENDPGTGSLEIHHLYYPKAPDPIPELERDAKTKVGCPLIETDPNRQIYDVTIQAQYRVPLLGLRCKAADFEAAPQSFTGTYLWQYRGTHPCSTVPLA